MTSDPGLFALIDDGDGPAVLAQRWYLFNAGRSKFYIARNGDNVLRYRFLLAKELSELSCKRMVDHISGDSLDNQRQNLRIVTNQANQQNRRGPQTPATGDLFLGPPCMLPT